MFTKDLLKSLVKLINFITSKKKKKHVSSKKKKKKGIETNNEQLYMIKYQLQKLKHP